MQAFKQCIDMIIKSIFFISSSYFILTFAVVLPSYTRLSVPAILFTKYFRLFWCMFFSRIFSFYSCLMYKIGKYICFSPKKYSCIWLYQMMTFWKEIFFFWRTNFQSVEIWMNCVVPYSFFPYIIFQLIDSDVVQFTYGKTAANDPYSEMQMKWSD